MTTIMNDSSGEQLDERKKHKENEELAKDNLRASRSIGVGRSGRGLTISHGRMT